MFEQNSLDFRRRDIYPAANDHVVVAALILIEAIAGANVDVSGNIPTVSHVMLLRARKIQISATGRTFHREQARSPVWNRFTRFFVDHGSFIAGNDFTGGAGAGTAN